MGHAESSPTSDVGGLAAVSGQSSFYQQPPNIARLIRSENSSKMEYEFPISDVPTANASSLGKHTNLSGNSNRLNHSSTSYSNTSINEHPAHNTGYQLGYSGRKSSANAASSLWFSLTSCFGCRVRNSNSSNMNPLRDKVHAIRIVRASNDLTPAVFDSHYNIIALEQLRECDTFTASPANDATNSIPSATVKDSTTTSAQNGNGSVTTASPSNSTVVAATKKDKTHRMKKKKKKRVTTTKPASYSDEDDDDDDENEYNAEDHRSRRT